MNLTISWFPVIICVIAVFITQTFPFSRKSKSNVKQQKYKTPIVVANKRVACLQYNFVSISSAESNKK